MVKVYRVENIVASISLRTFIPLKKLKRFQDTQYNPEQFPGLVFRIKDMHITFLVFGSGKLVCTGSRSRDAIDKALKLLISKLRQVGVNIKEKPKIEIQNIVASGNLNRVLDLNKIAYNVDNTEYNPEQFPGLVYKLADSRITFLLFGTGKIVCTGAKKVSEIDEAIKALLSVVNAK
ncbi:MAG: TATA-box-binding protein [Candidatus Parvarchaeota archaeon]|nr:TATA-box-binding protein [Candidatus Parvarchaeota archaeon]MCW1301656.1 TATA-box-binding protein [Candidatus Parvarchaeota archaeon]